MIITAGILFYLLDRHGDMQHICHGADRMELNRTEHFRSQKETQPGVLYIFADKKGVLLFCSEKKYKTQDILIKAMKETNEAYSMLWIPYADSGEKGTHEGEVRVKVLPDKHQPYTHSADEVAEYIGETWNYYSQIQNGILEAAISRKKIEDIMDMARGLLRTTFMLVDRYLTVIYEDPAYAALMKEEIGENYSEEIVDHLLLTKEFHDVEKKRESFYYFMENPGYYMYCNNITVEDFYYARLIVFAQKDKQALSSGEEQIADFLSGVVKQMIQLGTLQMMKSREDLIHIALQGVLDGYAPDPDELVRAVKSNQWNEDDTYEVIYLEPYMASGWEAQIENTMPSIMRKLEQAGIYSCAVFSGNKILWLINWTLSESVGKPYELAQQFTVMLRENVLRAGAGSKFGSIKLIQSALKEARIALELGTKKEPSYWFYRFDDFRLMFMIDTIKKKEIDPMLLIHPAIPVLMQHDLTHENELSKTLETLIEKRGNVTQAAKELFIHRTTLFRRMNQIQELTGIDLDDADLMLELQLSYRIIKK